MVTVFTVNLQKMVCIGVFRGGAVGAFWFCTPLVFSHLYFLVSLSLSWSNKGEMRKGGVRKWLVRSSFAGEGGGEKNFRALHARTPFS